MPCYHPMKAFYRIREDQKKDIHFAKEHEWKRGFGEKDGKLYFDKIQIPCGQCIGCRLEYSRQWAIRCVLEAKENPCNYFLTLTYDEEHLPFRVYNKIDKKTGEVRQEISHPLIPKQVTKFMKDLRRYFEYHYNYQGIRFFGCGEYGTKNGRPHYHIILFNCPIQDLKSSKLLSKSGKAFYESEEITKIWKKGIVGIGDLTWESAAYTARYIMKKHKGKTKVFYEENGLEPEFTRMSRDPGIAKNYYDAEKRKIYTYDTITIVNGKGEPIQLKPPKYYDKLYDLEEPEKMLQIKEKRKKIAENLIETLKIKTNLTKEVYLEKAEQRKINQIDSLKREI